MWVLALYSVKGTSVLYSAKKKKRITPLHFLPLVEELSPVRLQAPRLLPSGCAAMLSNRAVPTLSSRHIVGLVTRSRVWLLLYTTQVNTQIHPVRCFTLVTLLWHLTPLHFLGAMRLCVRVCAHALSNSCEAPVDWTEE